MSTRFMGPEIPARTSAKTSSASAGTKDRKRRSLPTSPPRDAGHRVSNRVTVNPASTEVISSLIETLSAISSPAEQHFESLPDINASHSLPASPRALRSDTSGTHAALNGYRGSHLLHPDRASVRGLSWAEASSTGAARRADRRRGRKGSGDAYSIGQVSVEAQPWHSSLSVGSTGSDKAKSLRSTRSFRSLRLKPSKDSFQITRTSRFDKTTNGMSPKKERLYLADSRSPSPPADEVDYPKRSERRTKPEDSPTEIRLTTPPGQDTPKSPKRLFLNTDEDSFERASSKRSSYVLPTPDYIPKRRSSIRHTQTISASDRKRREKIHLADGDPVEGEKRETSAAAGDSLKAAQEMPADHEESGVTRRIKELKEQKEQRKRLSVGDGPDDASPPRTPDQGTSPVAIAPPDTQPAANRPTSKRSKTDLKDATKGTGTAYEEFSAPPPTVRTAPLRIRQDASRRSISLGSKPTAAKHTPASSREEAYNVSVTIPQRRNSSLLKRLSQPTSPSSGEKQKRRLSNPVAPLIRTDSEGTSGGDSVDDAVERYISAPRLSQKAINPLTGRVISFSEVGDPKGSVVFCCVGMGLTRYVTSFYDELAATLKLRLITPDRPGIGGSEPHADSQDTPLGWPDDVRTICEHLGIVKFSLMAHSAGAIYALATALRMPQHIRCRVHLLAPWIPPSQLSAIGTQQEPLPSSALPYSQRVLRSLPTPFLKAANSGFFSINSLTTSLPRSPKRTRRKPVNKSDVPAAESLVTPMADGKSIDPMSYSSNEKENLPPTSRRGAGTLDKLATDSRRDLRALPVMEKAIAQETNKKEKDKDKDMDSDKDRAADYNKRLTTAIWDAATTNVNSAIDLIVCLERRQPIGFRYVDITRAVVIHHGSKDTRVPIENVKWLGAAMRRCEVRVLEGEGHGLMASAAVMGGVLMEMSQEWEDWLRVVRGKRALAS